MKKNKKNYAIYIVSILIYSLTATPCLFAEKGYVSDMLILSLKEGPGRQYNTIKTLRSNTPIEIISTADRFLKIQTEEGDVGWVESQYVTKEIPKTLIIEQLNNKIAQLEGIGVDSQSAQNREASQTTGVTAQLQNKPNSFQSDFNIKETEYLDRIKSLEAALNTQIEKNKLMEAHLLKAKSQQAKFTSEQMPEQNNSSTQLDVNNDNQPSSQSAAIDTNIAEKDIEEEVYPVSSRARVDEGDNLLFSEKEMVFLPDDDVLKTSMIKWFCAGAGVLIAGWFIGRSFSSGKRGRDGLLD